MKATGMVRRIDDLGRIVIPKEIRRTLRIREGDPLEIYVTTEGEVVFRKHSPLMQMGRQAQACADALYRADGQICLITDREVVIASAGISKKEMMKTDLPAAAAEAMEKRSMCRGKQDLPKAGKCTVLACPVLSAGDVLGCVVLVSDERDRTGEKLAQAAAHFLGTELEV